MRRESGKEMKSEKKPEEKTVERERHSSPNAEYWVKLPLVSSTTDSKFYMYYGNSGAASASDISGTMAYHNTDINLGCEEEILASTLCSSPVGCEMRAINLEIDGNGANQERADQRIITPSNVSYFYVRDCYIHDAAAAWIATTPLDGETYIPQKYWFIQNNIFDKIYTSGITSLNGHDISNAYIENNICLNPADVVINFAGSESKNLHIRGNKIYGGIGGIFLEQGAGDNSTITDNIIIQSGQNIYVSGKNAIIKGNYCYGGSYGIRSIGEKNIISNNILVNQDSSGRSISASDFDTVSNNKIDNSDTGAIGISIPRDKTACIKHNEIRGCSVGINTNSNPNCECVGNRFELCDRGIHLYCGSAGTLYTKNWLIESNYFVSCGVGISSWIDGGDNFGHRISNNMFVMTKKQPILLKRVHDCSIINNEIIDASAESANEYAAVELAQVCDSIKIIGNIIVSPNGYHKYCIALATISSSVTNCIIRRNYLRDWQTAPILLGGTGHIIKENDGYATENSGTATFSGDGVAKVFEIGAHGLVTTDPSKIAIKVTPASSDAIAASPCVGYVDPVDNTKIKVKFSSAPASGADNVKIVWYARVIS